MPTQTTENYLKAIFSLYRRNGAASITDVAEAMNVSKPTVNAMVKKMETKGWLIYEKYKPLVLTAEGQHQAALIVRKHRLVEMFLAKVMGFGWEEVHDIAEEMEHIKSHKLFERIDEMLGYPSSDPHGSPIPDKSGKIMAVGYHNLTLFEVGDKIKLCGLAESSKKLLLYLNRKNISLGTEIMIKRIDDFDNTIEISTTASDAVLLTHEVCLKLLVKPI